MTATILIKKFSTKISEIDRIPGQGIPGYVAIMQRTHLTLGPSNCVDRLGNHFKATHVTPAGAQNFTKTC